MTTVSGWLSDAAATCAASVAGRASRMVAGFPERSSSTSDVAMTLPPAAMTVLSGSAAGDRSLSEGAEVSCSELAAMTLTVSP